MALKVTGEYTTPFGTTVPETYWRWVGLGVDVSANTATVQLYGYVNENAFETGKQAIAAKTVSLTGQEFGMVAVLLDTPNNGGISNIIYDYLKANDDQFANATDA